jgi:glucose uptake protein GlcU
MKLFLALILILTGAFFVAARLADLEADHAASRARIQKAAVVFSLVLGGVFMVLFHVMDHPINP